MSICRSSIQSNEIREVDANRSLSPISVNSEEDRLLLNQVITKIIRKVG